jgi:hypothetical protein
LKRPTARELLFHPALFEIPSLKLLSVHSLADDIRTKKNILFHNSQSILYFITFFSNKLGLKPDRSFVSLFHHSLLPDQIFAESESIREGVKPVVFTYVITLLFYLEFEYFYF